MTNFMTNGATLATDKVNIVAPVGPANQQIVASDWNNLAKAALDIRDYINTKVFDVVRFGAKGDGTTNDQPAIQAAVNAAQTAGGGTVFFPRGTYAVCCPAGPVDGTNACIKISESNVILQGVGPGSIIKQFARGMQNPQTNWEVVQYANIPAWQASHAYSLGASVIANGKEWSCSTAGTSASSGTGPNFTGTPTLTNGEALIVDGGVTWRYTDHMFVGHLVYLKKGANYGVDWLEGVAFRDIDFDGNCGGWPDTEYPLSAGVLQPWTAGGYREVTTGKVFDMLNKLFFIDGYKVRGLRFERIKFHGNRAEGIYCGTNDCWNMLINDCEGFNTGGSIVSCTAEMRVNNSRFYHSGTLAENFHIVADIIYDNCYFADGINGYVDGGNYNADSLTWAWGRVTNCTFRNISIRAWTNAGYGSNYEISSNLWIDCGYASTDCEAIRINSFFGGAPYHTIVHHNLILCDQQECLSGISITGEHHDVFIESNFVGRSTRAVGNGHYIRHPYTCGITPNSTNVIWRNNRCDPWFENGFHVSGSLDEQYVGDVDASNINSDSTPWMTSMVANGTNRVNPITTVFGAGGANDHQYNVIPGISNYGYQKDGKTCTIMPLGSANNENWIQVQSDLHTILRGTRFINGNVKLDVRLDAIGGKWYEVAYYRVKDRLPPTANDLDLLTPNRIIDQAPNIQAYNCETVTLSPTSATNFNNWLNFIPGQIVRVIVNANAAIKHNTGSTKKLMLAGGADFSPGGNGGEIRLLVPSSSANNAYEVSRITY